jgi:hypothetical protein
LARVFEGDKKDKIGAFEARDIAIGLLKTKLKVPPFTVKSEKAITDWSVQFQFTTTFVLLAAILLIINC